MSEPVVEGKVIDLSDRRALVAQRTIEARGVMKIETGEPMVSSLDVAEKFGKRLDNVLRAIEELECSIEFRALNFEAVEIIEKNAIGGTIYRKHYDMNWKGFSFVVLGFTGKEAHLWREANPP
jgi:Rha family phage regulatory protein